MMLIHAILEVICKSWRTRYLGYICGAQRKMEYKLAGCREFKADHEVDILQIPICGSFPSTRPNLHMSVERVGKKFHLFDVEVCKFPSFLVLDY